MPYWKLIFLPNFLVDTSKLLFSLNLVTIAHNESWRIMFFIWDKKRDVFCIYNIKKSVPQSICFLWSGFSHFEFSFSLWIVKTLEVPVGSLLTSVLPEIHFTSTFLSVLKQLYDICYRFQLHLCIISHSLLLSGFTGPITNLIYFVTDHKSVGHPLSPPANLLESSLSIILKRFPLIDPPQITTTKQQQQ